MVFEGGSVALAALLLTFAHPGLLFPETPSCFDFLLSASFESHQTPHLANMGKLEKRQRIQIEVKERLGTSRSENERGMAPLAREFPVEALEGAASAQQPGTPRFSFHRLELPEELLYNWGIADC